MKKDRVVARSSKSGRFVVVDTFSMKTAKSGAKLGSHSHSSKGDIASYSKGLVTEANKFGDYVYEKRTGRFATVKK